MRRERRMKRIILVGYMGAGKTTIGRALAKELDMPFYDLDWYIENRMRKTIRQIFDERGEEGFRTIEKSMLHEVAEFENVIISCGGGTPCFFDNMEYMNQQGETCYLEGIAGGALQPPENEQERKTAVTQQNARRGAGVHTRTIETARTVLQQGETHYQRGLTGLTRQDSTQHTKG